MTPRLIRRPAFLAAAAGVLLAVGFAVYWFAPWNLVVDRTVEEALPSIAPAELVDDGAGDAAADGDVGTDDRGPATLSRGPFRSLEHATRGSALVVELADGSRLVRLEGLETSNGPDLRVILSSEAPQDDWHVYDDGELLDLGALKGNLGSSNYEIPDGTDLSDFQSVVVWCRRFSVGFGVAPLELVT